MSVMTTKKIAPAILLSMLLPCMAANAADSTISVNAVVKAAPCTVPPAMAINLGDYFLDKLPNGTAYQNNELILTACPESTLKVKATFEGTTDSTNSAFYSNSGTAAGVAMQVYKTGGSGSLQNGSTYDVTIAADRTATFKIASRVVVTDATILAVGTVSTTINVTFTYS